jgi:hypothetical protein
MKLVEKPVVASRFNLLAAANALGHSLIGLGERVLSEMEIFLHLSARSVVNVIRWVWFPRSGTPIACAFRRSSRIAAAENPTQRVLGYLLSGAARHREGNVSDESAFQPDFRECFNAVRPVAKQVICVRLGQPRPVSR